MSPPLRPVLKRSEGESYRDLSERRTSTGSKAPQFLADGAQQFADGAQQLAMGARDALGLDQLSTLLQGLNTHDDFFSRWMTKTLQKTVLNPHYYLRRQLFLSFGTTAFSAIAFFILIGLVTSITSGNSVMKEARIVQEDLVTYTLGTSARYVAETITKKFHNFQTASDILREATRDRIVGYKSKNQEFFTKEQVPFVDYYTKQRIYPLDTPDLVQLDWNTTSNIQSKAEAKIHLQGREKWYNPAMQVSTAYASYFFPKTCDPSAAEGDPGYYPDCTDANNEIKQELENPNSWHVYRRAKDLAFLLKALYEAHPVAKQIGIYFANGGAGSYVKFPAHIRDGRETFTSLGCGWGNYINPQTRRFILDASDRGRCHQSPGEYPAREYNALERPWCIRQAQATPGHPISTGPYKDASAGLEDDLWVLTFGHGVFDRLTQEFIGCTLVDISVHDLQQDLDHFHIGSTSAIALVRWDDDDWGASQAGDVVACGQCHLDESRSKNDHITDLQKDFGIDEALFLEMRNLVDYEDSIWNPDEVKIQYNSTLFDSNGRLIMMYPVPYVPDRYDPNYQPEFMVIVSISEAEIYGDIEEMNAVVTDDIQGAILGVCIIGLIGLVVIFAFLTWISRTLTKPLLWMQEMTAAVITNAGNEDLVAGVSSSTTNVGTAAGLARCSPKTEVTVLLSEFEMMMDGFSGKGAAEIADSKVSEVQNKFQWREDYQILYPYNFRTGEAEDDCAGEGDIREGAVIEVASVKSELTLMSALTALTEFSMVQAIAKPYNDITHSLSKSVSNLATASYTAGLEKLPGWAQHMLSNDDDSGDMPDYVVSPPRVNKYRSLRHAETKEDIRKKSIEVASSSRVFLWVSCGIQVPLLLTASAVVILNEIWIRANLDSWLNDVRTASFLLEQDAIVTATASRAVFGQEVMSRFMRDLHLFSRTAGWLLFGAISRSSTLTDRRSGAEECKVYPEEEGDPTCPFNLNGSFACDCDWDDHYASADTCGVYPRDGPNSSRYAQVGYFEGQRTDSDPSTGNRPPRSNRTIYSPSDTDWWDGFDEMPGANKGASAAGFETTYDRVRTLSALTAVEFPLYNYFPGRDESRHLGTYVGLEADGMNIGYLGCDGSHSRYPFWQSNDDNKAYEIAPELCPNNTHGYDARCRGWFSNAAKKKTYISPPYSFASSSGAVGTTAASAVEDKNEGLVAVAALDFLPEAFTNALGPDRTIIGDGDTGFAFVITPIADINGGNTIFGPNYDATEGATAIENIALPDDEVATANRLKFDATVTKMAAGDAGNTTFLRTKDEEEQRVFLAYAPVFLDVWRPLNNKNFSAGCSSTPQLIYSLGIAVDERDLYLRYQGVENRVDAQLDVARGISIAFMVLIAMMMLLLTYYISLNITRPIIALTMIVKSIKNKSLRDEIPDVEGGSREVSFVHESFQRLMKVVRFANTAFFAGDRTQSYHSMEEALSLFTKLGNQKAIGVANNNLGTMVLQEQMESHGTGRLFDNSLFGICISEIYNTGKTYFDEAIRHGSFEYEISKETDDQGSYAKQLANRYFSRGMFLVVVRHHPLCPSWIQEDGISDLLRAKDLDLEVLQFLHKYNLFKKNEVQEFEGLLRRTRGILALVRNYGFKDPWGVDSLIEQAQTLLNEANDYTSNLFNSMSRIGRTQQLDDLRMQKALASGDNFTAAKIAMRMLVEDEYIIDTVIVNAMTAVKRYFETQGIRIPRLNATQYLQRETRKAHVNVLREAKNVFFCLDYSGSMAGERMQRANKNLLWVYEEHCSDKDMVGFIRFNHDIDDSLWFPLGKKGDWGQVQDAVLKLAVDAEGGTRLYAALNRCVTQILKTETKNDTWIIALTDGESSWDHPAKKVVERIKQWNKKRETKIHVIIIGFEVPDSVIKTCEGVTNVTEKSIYVDARGGLDEMDKAFEQVVSVIGGGATTMETF